MADAVESSAHGVIIRPLVADDAPALAQCFLRCYGNSYVVAEFYDPAATAARIRDGALRSVVAVARSGEIVGHMGLTIRAPRAMTVDAGNSIVDPRYRGQQIVARLAVHTIELCREGGFLGFHHYPTTVHPIMQKLALAGGTETGIMLDYIPSGTDYREIEGAPRHDRPAVVVVYHPLRSAPAREVFAPGPLAELIRAIYARSGLTRTLADGAGRAGALPSAVTSAKASFDARRGLLRIGVEQVGADLRRRIETELDSLDAAVCQVDLHMADPWTPAAAETLGESGFFFSAVLPEYLDGDVLRLQRISTSAIARPDVVSPEAKAILRVIEADHARARSAPS